MSGQLILDTERLLLREFDEGDVAVFYQLGSLPECICYTLDPSGGLKSLDEALDMLHSRPLADYKKYGFGRLACVEKATGQVFGFAGLKYLEENGEVDLGYRLLPTHWGRGFATEASRAILHDGFTRLGLTRIIASVFPANVASVRVLTKLSFTFEKTYEYQGHEVAQYVIES